MNKRNKLILIVTKKENYISRKFFNVCIFSGIFCFGFDKWLTNIKYMYVIFVWLSQLKILENNTIILVHFSFEIFAELLTVICHQNLRLC